MEELWVRAARLGRRARSIRRKLYDLRLRIRNLRQSSGEISRDVLLMDEDLCDEEEIMARVVRRGRRGGRTASSSLRGGRSVSVTLKSHNPQIRNPQIF